jgi:uncharacterized membrane protein
MQHLSRGHFLLGASLLVALIGLADASYLGITESMGVAPVCNLIHGCAIVAASPYSRMFGIPLGIWGALFYTMIAGFVLWGLAVRAAPVRRYLLPLTGFGFALSCYFLYLQAFVIQAFCEYCLLSSATSTVLFVITLLIRGTKPEMLQSTDVESGGHGA